MKIHVEHTVIVTVEEDSEERVLAEQALNRWGRWHTSIRAEGFVTYCINAADLDDVARICQEMGS